MTDESAADASVNRRRLLGMIGGGTASAVIVGSGVAGATPGGGPNGQNGQGPNGNGQGVGPCTCEEECPEGTFCGKVEGPPEDGETYTFSSDGKSYSVTIESVTENEDGEVTCFTFSSDDDIQRVCIKGGPDTATYDNDPEGATLCAPTNPGGQQAEISNFSFCGVGEETVTYYQIDLAGGEHIEDLSQSNHYGDRLLDAFSVSSEGTVTDSGEGSSSDTVTVDGEECTFSWDPFDFDVSSQEVSIDVTLDATDHESDECEVTLAGYELPEGSTQGGLDNLAGQELLDYDTMTLEENETKTLLIDLD